MSKEDQAQLGGEPKIESFFRDDGFVLGGVTVSARKKGPTLAWSEDHTELAVNTSLFPTVGDSQVAALRAVGVYTGIRQAMGNDPSQLLQISEKHPKVSQIVLRLQGLRKLRAENPDLLKDHPIEASNQTLTQQFEWALDTYAFTGTYSDDLSDEVRLAIGRIPKYKGQNALDYISSGRWLKYDGQNFTDDIQPIIDDLSQKDRKSGQTNQFEYRPSQVQDLDGAKEPLEKSDITVRVNPFYGGYYREQVCRYDPIEGKIVQDAGVKEMWGIGDPPEDEAVWVTRRTYQGVFNPGLDTIVKLPYGALPLPSTLNSSSATHFMRDELGVVYLDPADPTKAVSGEFSFDFVLSDQDSNKLDNPPTDKDTTPAGGNLDPQTEELLDELSAQTFMSDIQKAREIVKYIRQKLRYPEDTAEIGQIDALYGASGQDLWTKIMETGVAHCYWANIFRDELCKRLGIASRIITGPYVGSRDLRFDFAAVEAPGLDKHAWGEVWDSQKEVWTDRGMDATPPKENDETDNSEDQEPMDGDFGESMTEQAELSRDEIEKLYQQLLEGSQDEIKPPTPEQLAAQQFQQEKGVTFQEWDRLEKWINGVNKTPVPPEVSIRHRPSTIYQEWRELFDLLYKRREIPYQAYKGPVRQSEGEFLDDPVTAYVDMVGHDDDPSGYQRSHEKKKEKVEVDVFDDDFILDVSASTAGTPSEEMRKMVMSSEYNIKNLNDRLAHTRYRQKMTTPLAVHSRVATFGNWTKAVQESTDTISEKSLVQLDANLGAQNQSSVGLAESLKQYRDSIDEATLVKIRSGKYIKVLTVVTDGAVTDKAVCIQRIADLRAIGIIVQMIGFGQGAQDVKVVGHDPADAEAAVVIDDVTQATLVRNKLLMKHLSKL